MGRRSKILPPKPCEKCGEAAERLVRVKESADTPWIMVCHDCWPEIGEDNEGYEYGGEWRARKRR